MKTKMTTFASVNFRLFFWTIIWLSEYATCAAPSKIVVLVGETKEITFNYTVANGDAAVHRLMNSTVFLSLTDNDVVDLVSPIGHAVPIGSSKDQFKVKLKGLLPGRVNLKTTISPPDANSSLSPIYKLYVYREEIIADYIFNVVVFFLVSITNVGLGCEVDLGVVYNQLKAPKVLAIGLFCQYVYMPLIGFAVVKYSHLKPGVELGLIALSCSPGGASSNAYAYLLGGDISISLTMTILSTTAALALLPLWFFTLGTKMVGDEEIKIPYFLIMGALVGIIMPCVLGIYIRRKHPNLAKLLIASIKYLMVFFCFVIGTVGVLLNWYVLQLMSPRVLLASALIPYIGYICGALTAFVLGQDRVSIITIAVETGIQNNGVPLVMMRLSLSGPERDTSIVGPVASALLSTQPLMLAVIVIHFLKKPGCPCAVITQVDVQPQISNGGICIEEHADKAQGTSAETS